LRHRAELVVSLGARLVTGDRVLDLACGDAGLAEPLIAAGLDYHGVDLSHPMVEAARARLGERGRLDEADLNEYAPPEPVEATTCFRAIYYARERLEFFRHVASYTQKKLVFDLNPRQYRVEDVCADLAAAGFDRVELRPFFSPQRVALPASVAALLRAAERSGPLARLALRYRFSYMVAASRSRARG
jgi:SAM-dependent methyltransferase